MKAKSPMDTSTKPTAVVVGASSGIGEALARKLIDDGWRVSLLARRTDRLKAMAERSASTTVAAIDLSQPDTANAAMPNFLEGLGHVDVVVVSAAVGHVNHALDWAIEKETLIVNTVGFAAIAQAAFKHFEAQGHGHLVGISSIAKLRASGGAASYGASKAFVSSYLDGLRDLARGHRLRIDVTEICPGFVDTPMLKAKKPFWVVSPTHAANLIHRAIIKRPKLAYVSRRWRLIAWLLKALPTR
ncbi:SDR family NAD(P)-dependent oxidoreductase [Pseudomonas sp. Marseille-QA0892]